MPNQFPRDPTASVRTRRALDLLSSIFNPWFLWGVGSVPMADGSGGFDAWIPSGIGPPSASNGNTHAIYLDVTNPIDPQLYYKT